ncbi:MAG: ferritin [Bacteroidales bacterium]|jgi:ferritin|nr:ferritin [Bacteroidales bacterium]
MVISEKMYHELNEQVNAELWSAYLYLSMSVWFSEQNLNGFAYWMNKQFQEEQEHAMKIINYVHERSGNITLKPIDKVKTSWNNPSEAFQDTYEHEQKVTSYIYKLMSSAIEIKDYATQNFLQWFVKEQVEEEDTALNLLETLKKVENIPSALIMLDKELGTRK